MLGGVNFPAKRWNGDGGVGVGAFLQQSQVSPLQPWFLRSQHSRWTDFHGNNVSMFPHSSEDSQFVPIAPWASTPRPIPHPQLLPGV